jgi:hypothetical protein
MITSQNSLKGNMACADCCRYFPYLRFFIGLFTFLAFLMGTLAFISPQWVGRDINQVTDATISDGMYKDYKFFYYGILSNGGSKMMDSSATNSSTKFVWKFKDNWTQWETVESKAIMIIYASGLFFLLISLWNITITECVPIKNQSTMLIMMVIWNILAALCIGAAIIVMCATWQQGGGLETLCEDSASSADDFKAFSLGTKCELGWSMYGALATACVLIIVTGLAFIGSYQAKNTRRDTAFRHM